MIDLRLGDCLEILPSLPNGSVHCCVTSPPYFGLRDYGVSGQIGLEATPDCGRSNLFMLRPDLTEAQRAYVVQRLLGGARHDDGSCGTVCKA